MVAGPSEVLVVADDTADAAFVAADLLAQAEHDPMARAVLLTPSGALRDAVAAELGRHTPEVVGDYVAGPNHVLPTGGTARFSSALSTEDFVTRLSVIEYSPEGLAEAGSHVGELSRVEGLDGHGAAAAIRIARAGDKR